MIIGKPVPWLVVVHAIPEGTNILIFRVMGWYSKTLLWSLARNIWKQALEATRTTLDDYAKILVHQVTMSFLELFLKTTRIPTEKVVVTLPQYGNMAAASLPVGFELAVDKGDIRRGDKVMFYRSGRRDQPGHCLFSILNEKGV